MTDIEKRDLRFARKITGGIIMVVLLMVEVVVCLQYAMETSPKPWLITTVIAACVLLDGLSFAEIFFVGNMSSRIIIYLVNFGLLLIICTAVGNSYLVILYCVMLTQIYLNANGFRSRIVMLAVSCILYTATFVIGWSVNHGEVPEGAAVTEIVASCTVGLLILLAHFCAMLFTIKYYRNNRRLNAALREADKRKEELEDAYEQLAETAIYEERNRIARDIHDNVGHSITAVIMQTEAAKLLIDTDGEAAKEKIVSANILAKNALEQMRDSVHLLAGTSTYRSVKDDLGVILSQTMDGTGVKIRCNIEDVALSAEKRRFIVNTVKECMSNGIRHGGATAFYVELKRDGGRICLIISDNGTGLKRGFKEGFGLLGIREKTEAFGGALQYVSEEGEGLEISVTIPGEEEEIQ